MKNSRMPAKNKFYRAMPGHPDYVPSDVEELSEHKKRREKADYERRNKPKKKKKHPMAEEP